MKRWLRHVGRLVCGRLLPRVAYPVVRGPLRGARFILGSLAGEGGGATVFFGGVEPEQTAAFFRTLGSGHILFDIGANVGYYTILGARLVGPRGMVVSFEPATRNVALLQRHIEVNRASNVTVIAAACADAVSLAAFSSGDNPAMGHLADDVPEGAPSPGRVTPVCTVSVDAVVERLGTGPDVMKIDVEGAELAVLQGARATLLRKRPVIFLSVHSESLRSACLAYLGELGYAWQPLHGASDVASEFIVTPAAGE